MKKFHYILGLILLALLLTNSLPISAPAQTKGAWVEYKLPGDRPTNWARMVGENCLIFVDRSAPEIYAFDINSASWQTYTASTSLEWSTQIKVGRNVAFVYNDEMVVAYNGLTQTFVPITYSGTMLPITTYGHDCNADMAYFVTDQYFYLFDGEDGIWHSYDISDVSDISSWGVYGIEDYAFLYLNETDDSKKIVAYSYMTKTFVVYDGSGYVEHRELEHGFIFYKNNTPAEDSLTHFFAGYSAFTGNYELIERANNTALWNNYERSGHFATTAMFEDRYRIVDDNWRIDLFGFDTRYGNFVQTGYNYTYTCNENCPYIEYSGGRIAVNTERKHDTGELYHIIFNGNSNSFSSLIAPLYYPTCSKDASVDIGGTVYASSDCSNVWFFDVEDWLGKSAPLPASVSGYTNPVYHRTYSNWSIADCKRALDSTVYVYSFHNNNNDQIQSFNFESALSFIRYDSTNVAGRMSNNIGGPYVLYLYAPGTDTWSSVDFGISHSAVGKGIQRDYIYWYDTEISGPLIIFDGVTGMETTLPFGWAYTSTANSRKYAWSNFLLAHSADDIYSGYSTYTRTFSEFPSEYLSSWKGQTDLAVAFKTISGGGAKILAYNVLYDNFVLTSYGAEYGTYFDVWVGGKTALIMTLPGHLLAWDPYADVSTDIADDINNSSLPKKFELSQNYPNPFNPGTTISLSIPIKSSVSLEVFNILSQKVKTIFSGELDAGDYQFEWKGTNESGIKVGSGVYFYRLLANGHVTSKKMLLLK